MTAARTTATGIPGYTQTVPCVPESARRARILVSTALNAWGIGELAEAGTLVVSELITNAIDHTPCRLVRVVIRRQTAEVVRIGVADKCRATPEPGRPDDQAEDGRGLLLVESLSWRWGYDLHRWGKIVWAELRVPTSC
ncbi:ATP-binding protein [Streptomyces sp. MUSC 14]|uniref:ATP-binding protein n=1 Tax=Streptomyces sp. MUSC 14 TaxID=1354889 RepID=UPI0008F576AA|nr:ATP-binding protein [Streptomyces sp. MUSC 14]OIJ96797.1 ATP-binding protein [Streptomyces sp. MUSC 14]